MFHRHSYENFPLDSNQQESTEASTQDEHCSTFTKASNVSDTTSVPQVLNVAYNVFQREEKSGEESKKGHLYYEVVDLVNKTCNAQATTEIVEDYDYINNNM